MQVSKPLHGRLHSPQCAGLVLRSTQTPLHAVKPEAHGAHEPLSQNSFAAQQTPLQHAPMPVPVAHTVSHVPQWVGSVLRFTHVPSQSVVPPGHSHCPFTHTRPVGQQTSLQHWAAAQQVVPHGTVPLWQF